jgi:uncharacterized membrane protein YuzA (DUF378 family)
MTKRRKYFIVRIGMVFFINLLIVRENCMKCVLSWVALALTIIGALNWGLWGFFQFDLVAWLFQGNTTSASRVVYSIVGLAGVYSLRKLCCKKKCPCNCSCCKDKKSSCCK